MIATQQSSVNGSYDLMRIRLMSQNIQFYRFVIFFFSLIIASKFNPTPLVTSLIEYVASSRPIVVYSQYQEVSIQNSYFGHKILGLLFRK